MTTSRIAAGLGLALLAGVGACGGGEATPQGRFQRVEVLRDVALEPDTWEVLEHPAGVPPRVGVLTPAVEIETDSADRPSIVLAPPSRVRFVVPDAEGPLFLRASAGIDQTTRRKVPRDTGSVTIGFDVVIDGETVFTRDLVAERPKRGEWDPSPWIWHHLGAGAGAGDGAGAGAGLAVQPGSVVELATRWVDPALEDGAEAPLPPEDVRVGFGGVLIERRTTRTRTRASADAPNLVLVVMDTLRADRLTCYGHDRPTSPHLDALAARGVRFENAYATASWTWPATASILTGLSPEAHGVTSNASCTLSQQSVTVAEVLQERGFTTAAFVANPLIGPERYFDQGFETFVHSTRGGCRTSDEVVPDALAWIDANAEHRFFLYLHLADPHTPHRPHPEELARLAGAPRPDDWPEGGLNAVPHDPSQSRGGVDPASRAYADDLYDASVATGDRWFGAVLERLAAHGLEDCTIVAFTADHGEELFDRGFVGHGHGLHGELVRVPLVLAGPGIVEGVGAVGVSERIVSNRHLAPTLALLGGAELDPFGTGEILLETDAEDSSAEAGFSTFRARWNGETREAFGLRRGDWLLHWTGAGREPGRDVRLYDLARDPEAAEDRSAAEPGVLGELLGRLEERLARERALRPAVVLGAGGGGLEVLYELGYIDREQPDSDD